MHDRTWPAAAAIWCALLLPSAARAQDVAAAEALFNRGVERAEAGDYEKACPAIGESYRLDPRPGTLYTWADCEARRGRIATAVVRYGDYLALLETLAPDKRARQRDREKVAREQRALLGREVPQLTVSLAPSVPRGTVVKRGDVVLAEPSLGLALPVDPGEHVLSLELPDKRVIARKIKIARGEKQQVVLDEKEPREPPAPPQPPPVVAPIPRAAPLAPPVAAPPPPPAVVEAPRRGPSARRIAAYATGAVGIAGLGAGAVFGGLALAKNSVVKANCGVGGVALDCNHEGKLAVDGARPLAHASTIGFVAGAALLGTGLVLFLTEPRPPAADQRKSGAILSRWVAAGPLSVDATGAVAGLQGGF